MLPIAALLIALALTSWIAVHRLTADPYAGMGVIAVRFILDFWGGGTAGVIKYLRKCYRDPSGPIILLDALRDCLVLDYTCYRMDMPFGQTLIRGPLLPYFERSLVIPRLARRGHIATFDNPATPANCVKADYELVSKQPKPLQEAPIVIHRILRSEGRHRPAKSRVDAAPQIFEMGRHGSGVPFLDRLKGGAAIVRRDRLVAEPDDRTVDIAGHVLGRSEDLHDRLEMSLHDRGLGMPGAGVPVDMHKPRKLREGQSKTLAHALRRNEVVFAYVVEQGA